MSYLNFVTSGLIGLFGGLAYEYAHYYMHEKYPIHNLQPQPEAFSVDPVSYELYAKMHKYKHLEPNAYRTSLLKTDSLFVLEDALGKRRVKPVVEDVVRAQTHAQIALKNAEKLLKGVKNEDEANELKTLIKRLEHMLDLHVENVRQLCKQM